MVETIIFSVLIIAIAMIFFCIKVIIKPGSSFSSQHIEDSQAMKDRGIHCVLHQDKEARKK
ncbi:MAG: hypothetical protein II708_02870 [Paludibacteraceae bacterium]|jgi:uncharacterized protein YoxC|nr:hypothetical protein [Prevotella sp.]MBQ3929874.1 hypothetical protein [Paludibacteraceae bacterium]